MTHKQNFEKLKKAAENLKNLSREFGKKEQEIFGFEFSETDSDTIIDTLNYGTNSISFDEYLNEMNFYKESYEQNEGNIKANGIY